MMFKKRVQENPGVVYSYLFWFLPRIIPVVHIITGLVSSAFISLRSLVYVLRVADHTCMYCNNQLKNTLTLI